MKQFLLFIVTWGCINVWAQEYKPMLTDGKMWVYATIIDGEEFNVLSPSTSVATVCGDTIVGGRTCKKLCYRVYGKNPKEKALVRTYVLYEEEGKVYAWNVAGTNDGFALMLNFNMEKGDKAQNGIDEVARKDMVNAYGEERQRLVFGSGNSQDFPMIWVEGVGSSINSYFVMLPMPTGGYANRYLLECYDNGKLIFTRDDFIKDVPTSIAAHTASKTSGAERMYDLSGRQTSSPKRGDVYVSNGEKHVAK